MVVGLIMLADVMYLSMAVVTGCNAVISAGSHDLFEFESAVGPPGFRDARLQKTAATAAAVVIGPVWKHIDEIVLAHNGFDDKPQILRHRISKGFPHQLAGILNRKLDFQVFVPVGIDLELSFPDPLRIILNDAFDFKIVGNVELFQSRPDCKQLVPSFGIEPDLALQVIHGLGLDLDDMLPVVVFSQKHAIILCRPALGAICPVCANQMQNFP